MTAGSNPGWVGSGANWQFPIGDLAAGASGVATFTVIADSPVPSGVTSITNVVSVDSDQAAGNTATDTDIYVAPECPTGVDLSAPCVPHGQRRFTSRVALERVSQRAGGLLCSSRLTLSQLGSRPLPLALASTL